MKRIHHICFTSHHEVFCRNYQDYYMLFNCIAQGCIKHNDLLLAFAIMSNHVHIVSMNCNPVPFVKTIRSSYTQMFNSRYGRTGALGDKSFFNNELSGRHHIAAAISYVMRNPMHHEVCANPYSYPFTSINCYFRNTIEKQASNVAKTTKRRGLPKLVRGNNRIPKEYPFYLSGQIIPDNIINSHIVEGYFGSYYSFHYNMHRKNFFEWYNEQSLDKNDLTPISLKTIEPHLSISEIKRIDSSNYGWLKEKRLSDTELCEIIDQKYVPMFHKDSYFHLSQKEREFIANELKKLYKISPNQLSRCLLFED